MGIRIVRILAVTFLISVIAQAQPTSLPAAFATQDAVDVSHGIGIPFGGIGTGFSVYGKYGFCWVNYDLQVINGGGLDRHGEWKITSPPAGTPPFAWQVTDGDQNFVLQEARVSWLIKAEPMDKVSAYAFLPKGYFDFVKAGTDLQMSMSAFSPMVPHDLANSTIPVQIFDVTIRNTANTSRKIILSLLSQQALAVSQQSAVLKNDHGTVALACDGGAVDEHGVRKALELPAGQAQTVRFYIGWNYPVVITASRAMREHYRAYYTKRFTTAEQVIDLARQSADEWSQAIDRWHDSYQVPSAFKRLWFSSVCSTISSTAMTDDPYFFEREVPHDWMNTMDVCAYSNWLYLINWPELERMDIDQYLKAIPQTGEAAGRVWHSLWSDGSEYAEEPTFIIRSYRDILWFNDPAWEKSLFPTLLLAANHVYHGDHYQYLLHSMHGNQSYDLWMMPGVNAYVNVAWVYSLYALDQLSQRANQPAIIDGMPARELLDHARQSLDQLLWNDAGKYWNTFVVPADRKEESKSPTKPDGKDTFSDQLFGKWMTIIDPNAETVLPADKVISALGAIYTNNLIDDPAKQFRGWVNGMKPGRQPEVDGGTHARTAWFGAQETLASLLADAGGEAKSLDVFNSLESSLHNNDLFVGEWNQSIAPDGSSRTLPEEPHKDTPRFPPYPRYKSCWEYLVTLVGLKMDSQNLYLKPFRTVDFALQDVELAGVRVTLRVQSGWSKASLNGKPTTVPVVLPRNEKSDQIEFTR